MNGGSKRIRTTRVTPPVTTVPEVRLTDGPVPPKHIPFPYIPQVIAFTFLNVILTSLLRNQKKRKKKVCTNVQLVLFKMAYLNTGVSTIG